MQLRKILTTCWILSVLAPWQVYGQDGDGVADAKVEQTMPRNVVDLVLSPAAEPDPVLKYRLYPEEDSLENRDAGPIYYRAFAAVRDVTDRIDREHPEGEESNRWWWKQRIAWNEIAIDELPLEQMKQFLEFHERPLAELRLVLRCNKTTWAFDLRESRNLVDTYSEVIPEMSSIRNLVRLIRIEARVAVAERRFEDAISSLQVGYKIAHDSLSTRFVIPGLVGAATAGMCDAVLVEMIVDPNAPNLYWALQAMPRPLIDMRRSIRHEVNGATTARMFPLFDKPASRDTSINSWNQLYFQTAGPVHQVAYAGRNEAMGDELSPDFRSLALALEGYSRVKRELVSQGHKSADVEAMPVAQAIAVHHNHLADRIRSKYLAILSLPFHLSYDRLNVLEDETYDHPAKTARSEGVREAIPTIGTLLPAMVNAEEQCIRHERRVALLQTIEAIRNYAADHGKLPESLAEIDDLPPVYDPGNNQPLVYWREGNSAILTVDAALRRLNNRNYLKSYRLTLARE